MGNEASSLKDYTISKESFGSVSDWVLYEGRKNVSKPISQSKNEENSEVLDDIAGNIVTVFVGMPGERQGKMSLLQNNIKTLMTLRHPDLLRFLSWQETGARLELVTEHVRPLAEVRGRLTEVDVSAGLLAVLRALSFLHRQAGMCHNNVCQSAVFVSPSGGWRLAGAEFACRFSEATPERLHDSAVHRYQPALAPEETQTGANQEWRRSRPWCRDVYAYGLLVEEVIGPCIQSEFPGARHFRDETKRRLLSRDPLARLPLDQLQDHDFFSNDFNQIHHFLQNLVLKSVEERKEFFTDLASRLRAYPEELVASRLSSLCLSRLVLLDADACRHFLPRLLSPRFDQYATAECILSPAVFRRHVVPQLLRILHVHDSHIRLVLLQHFSRYVSEIPRHLLSDVVLPELLLGIRDTDDQLVAATLRALADLVPILGAQLVIGPHRHKQFGDGAPKTCSPAPTTPVRKKCVTVSRLPAKPSERRRPTLLELSEAAAAAVSAGPGYLPERRSPEGGEELLNGPDACPLPAAADADDTMEDEEADWSDWEAADPDPDQPLQPPQVIAPSPSEGGHSLPDNAAVSLESVPLPLDNEPALPGEAVARQDSVASQSGGRVQPVARPVGGGLKLSGRAPPRRPPPPAADDFERFSIQVRRREPEPELDLFADMEPVIQSARVSLPARLPAPAARLDMSCQQTDSDLAGDAWADGDWGE